MPRLKNLFYEAIDYIKKYSLSNIYTSWLLMFGICISLFVLSDLIAVTYFALKIKSYLSIDVSLYIEGSDPFINEVNFNHFLKTVFSLILFIIIFCIGYIRKVVEKLEYTNVNKIIIIVYALYVSILLSSIMVLNYKAVDILINSNFSKFRELLYIYTEFKILPFYLFNIYIVSLLIKKNILLSTKSIKINKEKILKLYGLITFISVIASVILISNNYIYGNIYLTKENLRPDFTFTDISDNKLKEKIDNVHLKSLFLAKGFESNSILPILFDPSYANKNENIAPLVNYISYTNISPTQLNLIYKQFIVETGVEKSVLPPEIDFNKKLIVYRLDNGNKVNFCFLSKIFYNKEYDFTINKILDNETGIKTGVYNNIDKCIEYVNKIDALKYIDFVSNAAFDSKTKEVILSAVDSTVRRESISSQIYDILKLNASNSGAIVSLIQSFPLGYKSHHLHNFLESIFRADFDLQKVFMAPGQYGFGPVALAHLMRVSNAPFDYLLGIYILDIIIILLFSIVAISVKNIRNFNGLTFVILSSVSVLTLYLMGGSYAPALHYVRTVPQIAIILLFMININWLSKFNKNFTLPLLVLISIFYNSEFGIFTLIAYTFSEFSIDSRFYLLKFIKSSNFYKIIALTLVVILYGLMKEPSHTRYVEYLFGIGLQASGFGITNLLVIIIFALPIITMSILKTDDRSSDNARYKIIFIATMGFLCSIKYQWNSSYSHLIAIIPMALYLYYISGYKLILSMNHGRITFNLQVIIKILLSVFIIFNLFSSLIVYYETKKQEANIVRDLTLFNENGLGKNVYVTTDVKGYIDQFKKINNSIPFVSYLDSLYSLINRRSINSYYNDFATNTVNIQDISKAYEHLIRYKCIYLDSSLVGNISKEIPTFPPQLTAYSENIALFLRDRKALFTLSSLLQQKFNIEEKISNDISILCK